MLKGNISTRPFYNDRIVTMAIAVCVLVVLVVTVMNVRNLVSLSSERAAIRARLQADVSEAGRIRSEAEALQGRIDQGTLTRLADSVREANQLIDQRTFSWTSLLAHLEETLPSDVRLTSIAPRAARGDFQVAMAVVTRDLESIDTFMDALLDTGAFYDVAPVEQRANDDGTYVAVVQASYMSSQTAATPRAAAQVVQP
jgi:Tfp pilus assembly protein PilN